jgi:hypothetical protein
MSKAKNSCPNINVGKKNLTILNMKNERMAEIKIA